MSATEKPLLPAPVTTPAPAPAVQQEHAETPVNRSKLQKLAAPAFVVLLAAAIVPMRNLGPPRQLVSANRWAAEFFGEGD